MKPYTANPGAVVRRMLDRARAMAKAEGWRGGFAADVQMAQILRREHGPRALARLQHCWQRQRSVSRPHWGGVMTALSWMLAHPGETPTCDRIWPQLFAERRALAAELAAA